MKNIEEFKEYVDIYSADLSKWPVELVKSAQVFMADHAAAQKYFDDLADIESAMRDMPVMDVATDPLIQKVMARIDQMPQEDSVDYMYEDITVEPSIIASMMSRAMVVPWTGALVALAFVGFFVGTQPIASADLLMDVAFYNGDQAIVGDTDIYEGGIF